MDQQLGRRFANGVDLSGGGWQKIALARAYPRDSQILILDEPTASLDAKAEFEVLERFAELAQDKMAILISHRFSTVRNSDRIGVLEAGTIREEGTHAQLIRQGGRYAGMFQLQAYLYWLASGLSGNQNAWFGYLLGVSGWHAAQKCGDRFDVSGNANPLWKISARNERYV